MVTTCNCHQKRNACLDMQHLFIGKNNNKEHIIFMDAVVTKKHYNYIDRLKGLAITLVVMGHFILVVYEDNDCGPFKFINTVHMPLFMFLSGLVISKVPSAKRLIVMLFRFICPFLIVGGLLTLYRDEHISSLFTKSLKNGYWYLYILSLFYVFLFIKGLIRIKSCGRKMEMAIDILYFLLLYAAFWICYINFPSSTNDLIGVDLSRMYWPYFYLGHFTNKYNLIRYVGKAIGNTGYTIGLITLLFSAIYFLNGIIHLANILALSFIYVFLFLFYEREECNTPIENFMQTVGKSSLDVYIYHYFFYGLITFPAVGS